MRICTHTHTHTPHIHKHINTYINTHIHTHIYTVALEHHLPAVRLAALKQLSVLSLASKNVSEPADLDWLGAAVLRRIRDHDEHVALCALKFNGCEFVVCEGFVVLSACMHLCMYVCVHVHVIRT